MGLVKGNGASKSGAEIPHAGKYKSRDFDAEVRGKVACAAYVAAIQSPGLASFAKDKAEFDSLVEVAAEHIIKRTWEAQNG